MTTIHVPIKWGAAQEVEVAYQTTHLSVHKPVFSDTLNSNIHVITHTASGHVFGSKQDGASYFPNLQRAIEFANAFDAVFEGCPADVKSAEFKRWHKAHKADIAMMNRAIDAAWDMELQS